MKTFKLGILALVLGLFTLTSCEKEELESDTPTTLSTDGGTTDPVDNQIFIDSLINEWTIAGGASIHNGQMGNINFLVSSSGELDSLTFGSDWGADQFVYGGSFEYLDDGVFVFKYEQNRITIGEAFVDTVRFEDIGVENKIYVKWKNFQNLTPSNYVYTFVD